MNVSDGNLESSRGIYDFLSITYTLHTHSFFIRFYIALSSPLFFSFLFFSFLFRFFCIGSFFPQRETTEGEGGREREEREREREFISLLSCSCVRKICVQVCSDCNRNRIIHATRYNFRNNFV